MPKVRRFCSRIPWWVLKAKGLWVLGSKHTWLYVIVFFIALRGRRWLMCLHQKVPLGKTWSVNLWPPLTFLSTAATHACVLVRNRWRSMEMPLCSCRWFWWFVWLFLSIVIWWLQWLVGVDFHVLVMQRRHPILNVAVFAWVLHLEISHSPNVFSIIATRIRISWGCSVDFLSLLECHLQLLPPQREPWNSVPKENDEMISEKIIDTLEVIKKMFDLWALMIKVRRAQEWFRSWQWCKRSLLPYKRSLLLHRYLGKLGKPTSLKS